MANITIVRITIGEEKKICRLLEVKAAHVKAKGRNDGGSRRKSEKEICRCLLRSLRRRQDESRTRG
uniref:Gamma-tubulin complex component n=1 Tax=Oryza nivara TaxID=4536 RepID=A0A0E0JC63_ORYNI